MTWSQPARQCRPLPEPDDREGIQLLTKSVQVTWTDSNASERKAGDVDVRFEFARNETTERHLALYTPRPIYKVSCGLRAWMNVNARGQRRAATPQETADASIRATGAPPCDRVERNQYRPIATICCMLGPNTSDIRPSSRITFDGTAVIPIRFVVLLRPENGWKNYKKILVLRETTG